MTMSIALSGDLDHAQPFLVEYTMFSGINRLYVSFELVLAVILTFTFPIVTLLRLL